MKKTINNILSNFGYKISKITTKKVKLENGDDAFLVQRSLNKSSRELIIFDVGAYIGKISLKYNQLFPRSTIFSFEPFPDSYSKLEKNTSPFKNIITINKGLSKDEGYSEFQINSSAPTNSIFKTDKLSKLRWGKGLLETLETIEVKMTTIDNFVKTKSIFLN